jgi:hypothetical protein
MSLNAEQLLAIARNYWPADMEAHLRPDTSIVHARLQALWARELGKMEQWRAFLGELERDLPDFIIGNATAPGDGSFRCAAYFREGRISPGIDRVVVGCVSVLAPVYTIYGMESEYRGRKRIRDTVFHEPLPADMKAVADVMSHRIRATFDVQALPRELAETRVPLIVDPVMPPDTTLFHALFVSKPERVP